MSVSAATVARIEGRKERTSKLTCNHSSKKKERKGEKRMN